ncbi:MAG: hypothetical protein ACFBSC_17860 [Microcoleaceae cyanobacterium]
MATTSVALALSAANIAPAEAATIKRTIDFENRVNGQGQLRNAREGTIVDNEWEQWGVSLSTNDGHGLTLFDSDCYLHSCSGGDDDLASGSAYGTDSQGNVLIIQENGKKNSRGNRFSNPDDKGSGGTITFDFFNPDPDQYQRNEVTLGKIALLDLDDSDRGNVWIKAFTSSGDEVVKRLFETNSNGSLKKQNGDYVIADGVMINDTSVYDFNDAKGDNSLWEFDFGGLENVVKLDVVFPGSGAIAYVEYEQEEQEIPEPGLTLGLLALGAFGSRSVLKRKK